MSINNNRVIIEASGGINLSTISKYAEAKPHFISTGSIVHQSRWLDIGLIGIKKLKCLNYKKEKNKRFLC